MEVPVSGRDAEPDKLFDECMERDGAQLFGMDDLNQNDGEEIKQSRKSRRKIGCLPCAVPKAWKRAAQRMRGGGAMSKKEVGQSLAAAMLATLNYQHGGKRRVKAPDVEGLPETEPQRRQQRFLLRRAQEHLRRVGEAPLITAGSTRSAQTVTNELDELARAVTEANSDYGIYPHKSAAATARAGGARASKSARASESLAAPTEQKPRGARKRTVAMAIEANRVAFPDASTGGVFSLERYLPPGTSGEVGMREGFCRPELLVETEESAPKRRRTARIHASDSQFLETLVKMDTGGMLELERVQYFRDAGESCGYIQLHN